MRAPRAEPEPEPELPTLLTRVALASRGLMELEVSDTNPRFLGATRALEAAEDGAERAGEREEVAAAID